MENYGNCRCSSPSRMLRRRGAGCSESSGGTHEWRVFNRVEEQRPGSPDGDAETS